MHLPQKRDPMVVKQEKLSKIKKRAMTSILPLYSTQVD